MVSIQTRCEIISYLDYVNLAEFGVGFNFQLALINNKCEA